MRPGMCGQGSLALASVGLLHPEAWLGAGGTRGWGIGGQGAAGQRAGGQMELTRCRWVSASCQAGG